MKSEIDPKVKEELDKRIKRILGKHFLSEPYFSKYKFIENLYFLFWKIIYKIKGIPFTVKLFLQNLFKGYNDLDKWNAAWYISRRAVPVLTDFRNNFHGTSIKLHREDRFGNIIELSSDEIYSNENSIPESLTEDEWRAVLDDIIFAFKYQIDSDSIDIEYDAEKSISLLKRQKRGLKLFVIYFNNLWD